MGSLTNITMDIKQNMTLAEKLESDGWVYYPNIESLMKPWLTDANFVPTVTVYAVTFVLGLIGNSMVVFAMLGDQKNSSVATTFLASLAIADLLFLLVCVPYRIVRFLIGSWQDSFLCKFSGFVEMLAAVLSIFNLTAVSVERYVVIVHPMKARYLFTMGSIKKIVIAVWLVSAVLSAPMFHIAGITKDKYFENETKFIMHSCHDNEALNYGEKVAFVFYQFTLMFLLPTIVMVFCYTQVIRALWSSTQELSRMTSMHRENSISHIAEDFESEESQTQQRLVHVSSRSTVVSRPSSQQLGGRNHGNCIREARKQVIKMLIVIIIAFLICWGPKLILDILIKTRINRKIIFSPITFKIKSLSHSHYPVSGGIQSPPVYTKLPEPNHLWLYVEQLQAKFGKLL
ncbi:QRFP-like peptide receptor isoform X2 [Lingula anatina]|uniref:QRFP-like peptide receptor isoform X2 n=1 Tax=Lingula anatina TaxID=7574 RepID=A0A1S3IFI8_LINAN|nr:QRFP-like peptide receptor isoform X2 [Lingula anatina]|eukprot:XP_013396229.1 QRFP-like peptide receptor isoform X2 [Lingula anatina]